MAQGSVAVVDIGSNSIKVLIAVRKPDGAVHPVKMRTLDARISAGISQANPELSEAGMERGCAAIQSLLADATTYGVDQVALVATSAVRDAANGAVFQARVAALTGHRIRILSGDEEANLIGRGLTSDPQLQHLREFYVFDLGGGSLECLAFRDRQMEQALSVKLGCVRLTERFVPDPAAPLTAEAIQAISAHSQQVLRESGFAFTLSSDAAAVGTGGTVTTARAILGAQQHLPLERTSTRVAVADLRALLATLGSLDLASRQAIQGLPAARADVFPTALATLIALAELAGITAFENSLRNLRYGVADELLPR